MKKLFLLFPVLFLAVFFVSCPENKKQAEGNKQKPDQTQAVTAKPRTVEQPKQAMNLKPKSESKNTAPAPPPRMIADTTSLFALSPQNRIVVEDFKIGTLQDFFRGQNNVIAAARVVDDFLSSLTRRQIKEELIKEDVRKEITRSLSYPLKQDLLPESYRIGKAFTDDKEITVDVRLYKGQGVTEGEIYLVNENGSWLVGDLQIGFTMLTEKYTKDEEQFSPSSYKWLLKDYME